MRRGSCDDIAASISPQLKILARRRRSAPSLILGRAFNKPWPSIRESPPCPVSADQSPFVLGLTNEDAELIADACVQLTEGLKTKEKHLFLFSDVLVIAKLKSNMSFRLKHKINLCDLWIDSCDDEICGIFIDPRTSLVIAWPITVCIVSFSSPEVKERWLDTLHLTIRTARDNIKEIPKPPEDVLMKVLSGSSSTTKTLTGGCMDPYIEYDVEDAVKAYQPPARSDITDGTGRAIEGHKKRKKVLSWPFQRRSLTNSETMRSDFDMKTPLFGQPLSIVCDEEEKLPKPIMDILCNLLKKGINTEGIFRKAGNVKVFKEMKEHLNAGTEIDLDEKPVILLAAVLKDFLRQIPNSLLLTELYESWMTAMEKESVSDRYDELKQVVDKLPRPNVVFLEYFLCLLYHITKKSEINKMDAKNLAVCIAPNMLQLNPKVSLEVQKEMTEKVTTLTQFLIENCCEIFGENILSLLEEEELADSSDTLSSHQHDSAYDSTDADGDSSEQIRNIQSDLACSENTDLEERMSSQSFSSDALPTSLDSLKTFSHRYNRRCSEPDILASSHKHEVEIKSEKLARSHEDCSAERGDDLTFKDQNLKKQNSDDCVIKQRFKDKRPPNLSTCLLNDLGRSSSSKASSTCSLESTASSASVNSVFTSSPLQSPASPKRFFFARHQSFSFKSNGESQKNEKEVKKHSLSFSVRNDKKPLLKAKSWGPSHFNKSTSKKDTQKEGQFGCDTLQEDSQNEVEPCQPHPRNFLSPTEVFQQVDKKLPGRPPSYEQAIQTRVIPAPPDYKSMTVQDARRRLSSTSSFDKKSRPSSFTEALLYRRSNDSSLYLQEEDQTQQDALGAEISSVYRKRTMSESKSRHERMTQSLFEETFLVKESYV